MIIIIIGGEEKGDSCRSLQARGEESP